jgi:hypothetical protein
LLRERRSNPVESKIAALSSQERFLPWVRLSPHQGMASITAVGFSRTAALLAFCVQANADSLYDLEPTIVSRFGVASYRFWWSRNSKEFQQTRDALV